MEQFKENDQEDAYYNPNLLKAGLLAALGGLFIYSLVALIWLATAHS